MRDVFRSEFRRVCYRINAEAIKLRSNDLAKMRKETGEALTRGKLGANRQEIVGTAKPPPELFLFFFGFFRATIRIVC
jgi:hypothetical protein